MRQLQDQEAAYQAALQTQAAAAAEADAERAAAEQEAQNQAARAAQEALAAQNNETFYTSCDDARAAGRGPISRGESGYRAALDPNNNGVACEGTIRCCRRSRAGRGIRVCGDVLRELRRRQGRRPRSDLPR